VPLPSSFLAHLRSAPYHPRSDKHGTALAEAIVTDLIATCRPLAETAGDGQVVWDTNFDLVYGTASWNTDLVIGKPPPGTAPPEEGAIRRTSPSSVQIAIEIKGVMTEHRKAIKNRKRDLESHHAHVHDYDPSALAGGVLVLNIADKFKSPLRHQDDITIHRDPTALISHCIAEAQAISVRGGSSDQGLDAKCVIVVNDDNIEVAAAEYFEKPPAPQIGDPLHYDAFIQRLCAEWTGRFLPT
jgi:hypothetical protein